MKHNRRGYAPGIYPVWRLIVLFAGFLSACTTNVATVTPLPRAESPQPTYNASAATLPVPAMESKPSGMPTPIGMSLNDSATATTTCTNNLTYQKDLTLPDGDRVTPGAILDKRWLVTNSGACNWDERYQLRRTTGPNLGLADSVALYPARSGTQATIRLLLNAPKTTGAFRSAWQAYDPLGQPFGDPITIQLTVALPTATPSQ
jgi:hypothetical protein